MDKAQPSKSTTSQEIITSRSFYGSKRKSDTTIVEASIKRRIKEWNSRGCLPATPNYGILGPSLTWRIFPIQTQALAFAKENSNLMIFSHESTSLGGAGKKSFLVADPKRFFDVFIKRPLKNRNAYEVIPENSHSKIYFDLEFDKLQNTNSCGSTMTKIWIKIVKYFLQEQFTVNCSDEEIISLDSSTDKKFSKHVIFNLKKHIFQNNHNVGNVVRKIHEMIVTAHNNCKSNINDVSVNEINSLFINDKEESKVFCDMGVYTRNRNFRVYKATKLGKNTPLVLSEDCQYLNDEKDLFLNSLISYLGEGNTKIVLSFGEEKIETTKKSFGSGKTSFFDGIVQCQNSPYEELDQFIKEKIKPGHIRNWKYFPTTQNIVYSVDNFRYCHNISREHKSNGILLVANINKKIWYQKCLDPDCFGFKSDEWPLPNDIFQWIDEFDDLNQDGVLSNATSNMQSISDFMNDDEWFNEGISVEVCGENDINHKDDWFNEGLEDFILASTQINGNESIHSKGGSEDKATINDPNVKIDKTRCNKTVPSTSYCGDSMNKSTNFYVNKTPVKNIPCVTYPKGALCSTKTSPDSLYEKSPIIKTSRKQSMTKISNGKIITESNYLTNEKFQPKKLFPLPTSESNIESFGNWEDFEDW